jgi:hypothetical protein
VDKPLTLKHAFFLLLAAFVVAALPVGWMYTKVEAQGSALDYRLDSTNTAIDAMNVCRQTQSEATANKERISQLETNIEQWEGIAAACENAIRATKAETSSP